MEMEVYDDIIVGGGPTGLVLAWYLSSIPGRRVVVVDEHESVGGCHRVSRSTGSLGSPGLFCEHSPRVYSDNFLWFQSFLEDMGLDFYTYFTPYGFSIYHGIARILGVCTLRELLWLAYEFVMHTLRRTLGRQPKTWVVQEFLVQRGFSVNAADVLDRFCRLFESAGTDRMTMFELLELLDQMALHTLYVPSEPTDTRLFPLIVDRLRQRGVDFQHSTRVVEIVSSDDSTVRATCVRTETGNSIQGSRFLFAIPLVGSVSLFEPQHPVYAKTLRNRVQLSSYELYPTVVFHWNKNRPGIREALSPGVWGFPVGPWGVISIIMGDQCLLSTTLSLSMGKVNGYTVAEFQRTFSATEFAEEVFRQVVLSAPYGPIGGGHTSFSLAAAVGSD
jgi:hypothetical protein